MLRAGVVLAELHGLPADDINHHKPTGQAHGGLDGIGQAAADGIVDGQAVHHNFHRMLDVFLQLDFLIQIIHVAVDPNAGIAAASGGVQFLGLCSLTAADHRGQHLEPGAFR